MQGNELEITTYEIDGNDYLIGKEIDFEGSHYVYLINMNDETDTFLRKDVGGELKELDSKLEAFKVLEEIKRIS